MKATLKGRITRVLRDDDGTTSLSIETKGKVEETVISAKEALFQGELNLKSLVADQLKIGATITITVTDEADNERLD
jgi:hypothetical protein